MHSPSAEPELPRLSTTDLTTRWSCVVLVDAHGPPYFATGHIPGAVNIPPHDVARLAPLRLGDPRAPVVVYGSKGSSNAGIVAQQLSALGYTDVSLYEDGLEGWIAAGLPIDALDEESGADDVASRPHAARRRAGLSESQILPSPLNAS